MPYIEPIRRLAVEPYAEAAETAGELNFQITRLMNAYVAHHGLRYSTINDIMGAAEGAKQEFYRRVAVPYEDKKIQENGDIY